MSSSLPGATAHVAGQEHLQFMVQSICAPRRVSNFVSLCLAFCLCSAGYARVEIETETKEEK